VKRLIALALMLLLPTGAAASEEVVHVVPGSQINLVARDARIPITVQNPTSEPVTVRVMAVATSFRLEVLQSQEITIPALTSAVAELPVRAIANGPVQIRVWLERDGERIGEDVAIEIRVNYDVELFILVSLAVAMFGLIIFGVIRTVMKLARSKGE